MSLGLSPNARATSRGLPASCVIAAPNFRGDLDERLTEFTTTGNSPKQRVVVQFGVYSYELGSNSAFFKLYHYQAKRVVAVRGLCRCRNEKTAGEIAGRSVIVAVSGAAALVARAFAGAASRRRDVSRSAGAADARGLRRSGSRRRLAPCFASYEPVTNRDQCSISSRRALK
jgi:hypothetical protein